MRRLIVTAFLSLDGVMQAPGGPGEDEENGFGLGGWAVTFWDGVLDEAMSRTMGVPFDLILGRKTYDIFAAYWPHASEAEGAGPLNIATKHVASRGRPTLSWERSQLIEGDVAQGVAALKEQDGPELQVHGSADLLQTLVRHNLIDEYQLKIFPVVLGSGKRLFGEGAAPAGLHLVDSVVSSTGVLLTTYRPAGEVQVGTMGQ